jgi:hypothetical protein
MAKRRKAAQAKTATSGAGNGSITNLTKELWQAAVTLRGSIEPADTRELVPCCLIILIGDNSAKKRAGSLARGTLQRGAGTGKLDSVRCWVSSSHLAVRVEVP